MVAAAIVEHIRLCNWRVERGPPWDSTGKCFSPAADHECRSASPAVPAIGIRTARALAAISSPAPSHSRLRPPICSDSPVVDVALIHPVG